MTATPQPVVHSDPEIVSGTHVPVDTLFDHLVAGDSLDVFLDDFPTVSRDQALNALEFARQALQREAYARSPR